MTGETIEERVSKLEAQMEALKDSITRANAVVDKALEKDERILSAKFASVNEFREAMQDLSRNFVTRNELYWALAGIIAILSLSLTFMLLMFNRGR